MKNSKFSFKRAMALVICLCMVVSSLVFAPVVSAETEIANTNTQEYQYYDIDNTEFSEGSKYERASLKEDDGTGNNALRLTKNTSGATAVYGQLDHALEAGKEYTVSFYVKGKSMFVVSFTDSPIYDQITKAQYISGKSEKPYNNEEYTKVTLGPVTIPDDATYNTVRFMGYKVDAGSEFDSAVCYIDNITIVENNNTPEVQNYDFDYVNPANVSNQSNFFSKVTEEDGNVAIKGTNKSSGTLGYYMQLDHTLEVGKKYIVTLDFKGKGRFRVALCNDLGWNDVTGVPDNKSDSYSSPDGYTRYRLEMTNATTKTYNSIVFLAEGETSIEGTEFWFDNIVIEEYPFTQEKQGFDFDEYSPVNPYNENPSGFSVVTEEDGNKALKVTTPANGTKGYYMQLDFPVEKGKKYKVAFDYKGEEGSFWVGLFDKLNWGTKRIKFPNGGHYFEAKEEYTHYELELTSDTDLEYICLAIMAQKHSSVEAGTVYYIDNIVLTEEVDVTVGTAENGKTSVDGKAIFYGDSVDLTALPNPAYKFVKWIDDNGAEVSFANPYSFVAKEAFNITPVFEAYEATEYVRDFDNEEYNNMAPIVGNNSASVEYVYNGDIEKTVAKITIKNDNGKIAIPFVPKDGKDYRVKITYLYTKWFCLFYNGAVQGGEGPSGDAGKWLTKDWYYTQSGNDFFYLFTTKLATNAPAGEPCTIFIDSISFIESTKGDLNNDDAMDSLDITLLRKFLMGDNENDIDLSAANVSQINDDDKIEVDVKDLVALKKKIVSNK